MNRARNRRSRWRIALYVGIPILAVAGALLVLLLVASQTAPDEEAPVETRAIPDDWLVPDAATQSESAAAVEIGGESPSSEGRQPLTERTMSGALAILGNGSQFGEESYEIQISDEYGVRLTSRGTFSFKVLFATVTAGFSQDLSLDRDLRPGNYTLDMNGPLGIGSRRVEGAVVDNVARVTSGDKEEETQLGTDRALILGTFSTYAVIPFLFRALGEKEAMDFQVISLMWGGDEGDAARKSDGETVLRVEKTGSVPINTGAREIIVDRYVLTSGIGDSTILAKDDEFLALIAASDQGSLIAYRSDYFPHGIELP